MKHIKKSEHSDRPRVGGARWYDDVAPEKEYFQMVWLKNSAGWCACEAAKKNMLQIIWTRKNRAAGARASGRARH